MTWRWLISREGLVQIFLIYIPLVLCLFTPPRDWLVIKTDERLLLLGLSVMVGAILWLLDKSPYRQKPSTSSLLLIAYSALSFLSILWSPDQYVALAISVFLLLTACLSAIISCINITKSEQNKIIRFLAFLAGANVLMCITALTLDGHFDMLSMLRLEVKYTSEVMYWHANTLTGIYTLLAIMVIKAISLSNKMISRFSLILTLAGLSWIVMASSSQTSKAILILIFIGAAAITIFKHWRLLRRLVLLLVFILISLLVALYSSLGTSFIIELGQLGDRYVMWYESWQYIISDQWYGAGSGQWVYEIASRGIPMYSLDMTLQDYTFSHAHNIFVTAFAELGMLGFLIFTAALLVPVYKLYKSSDDLKLLKVGALLTFVALGMFYGTMYPHRAIYIPPIFVALMILINLHSTHDKPAIQINHNLAFIITALTVTCGIWILQNQIRMNDAERNIRKAEKELDIPSIKAVEDCYDPIALTQVGRYHLAGKISRIYKKAKQEDKAIVWQQKILQQRPNWLRSYYDMAILVAQTKGRSEALPYALKAHEINPYDWRIKIMLARIAIDENNPELAASYLDFEDELLFKLDKIDYISSSEQSAVLNISEKYNTLKQLITQ